jgi:hypothetical protein
MNVWIIGDTTLTQPLAFDNQAKNVVVLGKLTSNFDVSFKVNNLVIFGQIITTKNITINTKANFFNSGTIKGYNISILSDDSIYNCLDDLAIEKIRALGIDLTRSYDGLTVHIPQ